MFARMQNTLRLLFPDQCVSCRAMTDTPHGLCGSCWSETPFLDDQVCDACGLPLIGDVSGFRPLCDDCMVRAPAWSRGRAAVIYRDNARRLILALKHGDRLDLGPTMSRWIAAAGQTLLQPDTVIVPVPLHWSRLTSRRYNQAAVLGHGAAKIWNLDCIPDALSRVRRTRPHEDMSAPERAANMDGSIRPHRRIGQRLDGRPVILVDDVMTTGATLASATKAAYEAGARDVDVLALARVVKD